MVRLEGWEVRLTRTIEAARTRDYALGEHDCFRLACQVVQALCGVDLWPSWAGRYSTKIGALRLIVENGGTFTGAFSQLFGQTPVSVRAMRRGDIVEYQSLDGEQHLAVCIGEYVAALGENGLKFVPLLDCRHGWRIG